MRPIRLLVDCHWFDDHYESTAVHLKGLYKELRYNPDFEIFAATSNPEKLQNEFGDLGNIRCIQLSSKSKYYRLAIDLPRIIKTNNIDVAHFQYISPLFKTCKEIVTIHDLLFMDFPKLFPLSFRLRNLIFFSISARRADLVTTVSEYSLNRIKENFNIPSKKLSLISNGISEDFFKGGFKNVKDIFHVGDFVLCVSRIEPRKNQILLLRSFCELKLWEKKIYLIFIGRKDFDVPLFDSFLANLPEEIRSFIKIIPEVSFDLLKSFYLSARLVVYPSLAEGFGLPPLEAAALGVPVLCSNATAMNDFFFLGENLFDPMDIDELNKKILLNLFGAYSGNPKDISSKIALKYDWKKIAILFEQDVKKLF
jgi:glycosyltransferase involved in cell wall biosynthesis